MILALFGRGYRYSHLKNVRVHRTTMVVQRLYITKMKRRSDGSAVILERKWKVVDWRTTYESQNPLACPRDSVKRLLQTAF